MVHRKKRHSFLVLTLSLYASSVPLTGMATPTGTETVRSKPTAPWTADWGFRDPSRPVKVVVLAGSIGAWPRDGYPERLRQRCAAIEVRNLAQAGLGAWALKRKFREQVLQNRRVQPRRSGTETWLLYQGGLNSVADPERTSRHMRDTFLWAHQHGMKVVAFTLTPWGDDHDRRRWAGVAGLRYWRATSKVVNFVMGRLTPDQALGLHNRDSGPRSTVWGPGELPDIAVDLYDSDLRDKDAPLRDVAALRLALEADPVWRKGHAQLDPDVRSQALDHDAVVAAEIPRWYLRSELRSFDHIHLNAAGHRMVADLACPALPASWECACASEELLDPQSVDRQHSSDRSAANSQGRVEP